MKTGLDRWIVGTFLAVLLVWAGAATLLPVTQDEAYYMAWSRDLTFGYFDHPPLVAVTTWFSRLQAACPWMGRLGNILCALGFGLSSYRLGRAIGLNAMSLRVATAVSLFSLIGLGVGVLATPDTPLFLFWALALSEAVLALRGSQYRWLTAGLATGLGIYAKYTMVLIGPVFLWALIVEGKSKGRGLRSPWPYLGGGVALLVILPHLAWSAQHDWLTLRFQMRHGLSLARPETEVTGLPRALPPAPDSVEARLGQYFAALEATERKEELKPKATDEIWAALNRTLGWYGAQLGFWGAFILPLGVAFFRRRRTPGAYRTAAGVPVKSVQALVVAGAAFPLCFFAALTLGGKIEGNWSAMYMISAVPLAATLMSHAGGRLVGVAALVNTLTLAAVVSQAAFSWAPVRAHRDRLLKETHGYGRLATYLATLGQPVLADTYQLVAMTRFYEPGLNTQQWPGITRDSQFSGEVGIPWEALRRHGSFWLVLSALPVPVLPGFRAERLSQLRDCKDGELQVINAATEPIHFDARCKQPIHEWYLVLYGTAEKS